MSHPAGSFTCDPSPRFTVNRGLVTWFDWYVNADNASITFDGEIFTIYSVGYPHIVQFVQILPAWWQWSSNAYTLDHLVQAYWYIILPSTTEIPNAGLVVRTVVDKDLPGIGIQFEKEAPGVHVPFDIEQAPGEYWLYPVPPNGI